MDRLKNILPSGMLVAYVLKMLLTGSVNFPETGIVLCLTSLVMSLDYFSKHTTIQKIEKDLEKKFETISKVVEKQNLVIKEMAEEVSSLKTNVTASRLQQGMKNVKV